MKNIRRNRAATALVLAALILVTASRPQAMVVTRPFLLKTGFSPVFISMKQPVP